MAGLSLRGAVVCIALGSLLALPAAASATDYNVNTLDDTTPNGCGTGTCTLREAVQEAANKTDQHIHLDQGSYTLSRSSAPCPSPARRSTSAPPREWLRSSGRTDRR